MRSMQRLLPFSAWIPVFVVHKRVIFQCLERNIYYKCTSLPTWRKQKQPRTVSLAPLSPSTPTHLTNASANVSEGSISPTPPDMTRLTQKERMEHIVYKFTNKIPSLSQHLYGIGYAPTGALGRVEIIAPPQGAANARTKFNPRHPVPVMFFNEANMRLMNLDCGYGFTVFIAKAPSAYHQKQSEGDPNAKGTRVKVFGCGLNTDSQLGFQPHHTFGYVRQQPTELVLSPQIVSLGEFQNLLEEYQPLQVACGRAHTVILLRHMAHTAMPTDDVILTLGNNIYGQCGRPVVDNEVFRGSHVVSKIALPQMIENGCRTPFRVRQLLCGATHSLVLTEDGRVWAFGRGVEGQTGQGVSEITDCLRPVGGDITGEEIVHLGGRVNTVMAVSKAGQVFAWGASEYRQVYSRWQEVHVLLPTHLPMPDTVTGRVLKATATENTCAVLDETGQVHTWGMGPAVGLGPQQLACPYPVPMPRPLFGLTALEQKMIADGSKKQEELHGVTHIVAGLNFMMAITRAGSLYSWGVNRFAALGLAQKEDQTFPARVSLLALASSVACGAEHSMVLAKSLS